MMRNKSKAIPLYAHHIGSILKQEKKIVMTGMLPLLIRKTKTFGNDK